MKVVNETPWNTEDLQAWLEKATADLGITEVTVQLLEPKPGTAREKQPLAAIHTEHLGPERSGTRNYSYKTITSLTISLLSPKRAEVRTDALDRLSVVEDLKANEARLPTKAIARIHHGLAQLRERNALIKRNHHGEAVDTYRISRCMQSWCECVVDHTGETAIIRGDTKVKTHVGRIQGVTMASLQDKHKKAEKRLKTYTAERERAEREVIAYTSKEAEAKAALERVEDRIRKFQAKESMSVPITQHVGVGAQDEPDDQDEDTEE